MNEPEKKWIILQFLTFRKKPSGFVAFKPFNSGLVSLFNAALNPCRTTDPANSSESQPIFFETSKLTIVTADDRHRFWIEIGQSTTQR